MVTNTGGIWSVRLDLLSAKVLVWAVTIGRDVELTPETHLYFFGCYRRLAEHHRRRGHLSQARRLDAKAKEHLRAGGDDGPPYAAAMGMPRPRRWIMTDAVSHHHIDGPDDAA